MLLYQNILKNYQEILNAPKPKKNKESRLFAISLFLYFLLTIGVMSLLWEDLDSSASLEDENFIVAMLIMCGIIVFSSWAISLFSSSDDADSRYQKNKKTHNKQYAELHRLFVNHKMYMIDAQSQYRTNREMMQKVKDIDREILKLKKTYAIKDI